MDKVNEVEWRRACGNAACVEVAKVDEDVLVRDSKDPDVVLRFTDQEWVSFVEGVKAGKFRF
ncbi:DUF397 domain-containing protein [Actinoplanes sp. KI2]|uniref:DUF397 domain-containing protein n=1 Tax=Actinoplanes sp. KI2 TaxID=2983315 RepID=UPI0021D5F754|nr:DUF397 domain-containing protein [Actinoplanes sp. KI2]MCU7724171.1 DUF397 domain-containing protein [Actinoplanes sp. KI2]